MTTDITLFGGAMPVPLYLQNNPLAKQLAEQMEGGLAGNQINRISLRNGKFRFLKKGVEIAAVAEKLDVVLIAANPTVGRLWYAKAFDPDAAGTRPDCYSREGVRPEADSPLLQSPLCGTCPRNAVGSANNGKGKACAYKKRTVLVSPTNISGDAYALDAGSMTMFGDEDKAQRLFNLKSYIEALKAAGLIVPAVVTRLTFDDEATVPKLHLTPIRPLTEQEFAQVTARINDPAIREMLDDIDLKSEEGVHQQPPAATAPTQHAAQPAPAPQQAAPAPQPAPVQQPAASVPPPANHTMAQPTTTTRRGRQPKAETAPATAPAPNGFPPANGTAPAADAGFGFASAPAPQAAPAAPAAQGVPGFSVDLDAFDA
jgi:hypothetical protein